MVPKLCLTLPYLAFASSAAAPCCLLHSTTSPQTTLTNKAQCTTKTRDIVADSLALPMLHWPCYWYDGASHLGPQPTATLLSPSPPPTLAAFVSGTCAPSSAVSHPRRLHCTALAISHPAPIRCLLFHHATSKCLRDSRRFQPAQASSARQSPLGMHHLAFIPDAARRSAPSRSHVSP